MKNLFAILLPLCLTITLNAQQLQPAIVKAVHDGDSYKLSFANAQKPDSAVWVRLYGVDAPEVRFPGVIRSINPTAAPLPTASGNSSKAKRCLSSTGTSIFTSARYVKFPSP